MKVFLIAEELLGMWTVRAIGEDGALLDGQQASTKAAAANTLKTRLGAGNSYVDAAGDDPALVEAMQDRPMPAEAENERIAQEEHDRRREEGG